MPTNHDPPDTHDDDIDDDIEHGIEEDDDDDPTGELAELDEAELDAALDAIDIYDHSRSRKRVGEEEDLRRVDAEEEV